MKQLLWTLAAAVTVSFTACIKVNIDDSTVNNGSTTPVGATLQDRIISSKVISGSINENVELPKGKYTLKGYVYVNDRARLTIAAGSVILSDTVNKGAIIVEQNSRLIADGTASEPIIFTSGKAPGQRKPGDWGGIIICGRAPINLPGGEGTVEGGTNAIYGGTNAADNSGKLKYVRIEFCGIAFQPNQEINGLTMGGVGNGTEIEYVQISYSGDDSYEWFGGKCRCHFYAVQYSYITCDCKNGIRILTVYTALMVVGQLFSAVCLGSAGLCLITYSLVCIFLGLTCPSCT